MWTSASIQSLSMVSPENGAFSCRRTVLCAPSQPTSQPADTASSRPPACLSMASTPSSRRVNDSSPT